MIKRTKIVCTIGPSVNTEDKIFELIEAGMNVARVNFSHGSYEKHAEIVNKLKKARRETKRPLAIMLDTKGPEIRLGKIKNDVLSVEKGQKIFLVEDEGVEGDGEKISITPKGVLKSLKRGMSVLFNDGLISSLVVEKQESQALLEIQNSGELASGKGVNIPNALLDLPAMTEQDILDICFACTLDVDIIAASFIRSSEHVIDIKKLLASEEMSDIKVLAKIENAQGVENFDSILHVADGIMIARGDLGVEVPLSHVPRLQKMMIRKCYLAGKPSVTATQMLESMIHYPRPTRAETSDVANAIYDSTSAVMLSGETAIGRYPIETVKVMRSIIEETEKDFDYRNFLSYHANRESNDVPTSITLATVKTAYNSNASAIFAFTKKGATGRLLSRLRPSVPIVTLTSDEKSYHQMALNWGVHPIFEDEDYTCIKDASTAISKASLKKGYVKYGDLVVFTAGSPFGVSGTTNTMTLENIGEVLVRGKFGLGKCIYGKVFFLPSLKGVKHYEVQDCILVISKCDESYVPYLQKAVGVVLESSLEDKSSEKFLLEWAENKEISLLFKARRAFSTLNEGQRVTLNPKQALIYKGVWRKNEQLDSDN